MSVQPTWLGRSAEVTELRVPPHGVLIALLREDNSSVIASFERATYQTAVTSPSSLAVWIKSTKLDLTQLTTSRVIGPVELAAPIEARLLALGVRPGKPVVATTGALVHFLSSEGRIRMPKAETPSPQIQSGPRRSGPLRVLVVDDSETIRRLLSHIIDQDPALQCVETIESPLRVMEAIDRIRPDVVTLDIHMPEMDGVTLLKQILARHRIPVIMISALSREDGTHVLDALEAGAVDYIQKPSFSEVKQLAPLICEKIRSASLARVQPRVSAPAAARIEVSQQTDLSYLLAIGSSTGGTEALKTVLTQLPARIPPIVIVQHIPPVFSRAFADRMNQLCAFEVKEAETGDAVVPNRVLVAPGGKQMKVRRSATVPGGLEIVAEEAPPVNRHVPSVDVLFDSIVELSLRRVVAVVLTGMGADGARGLLRLRQSGARTFAQDEATSVVYGMPKEALRMGGAEKAVSLGQVAHELLAACQPGARRGSAA